MANNTIVSTGVLSFGPCVALTNTSVIDSARLLLILPIASWIGVLMTYSIRRDFRMYVIDIFTLSIAYVNFKSISSQLRYVDPWISSAMQECIRKEEDWTFPDHNFISWIAFIILFIIYKRNIDRVQPLNGFYIVGLLTALVLYCTAQYIFGRMSIGIMIFNLLLAFLTTAFFIVILLDAYFNMVINLFPIVDSWTSVDLVVNTIEKSPESSASSTVLRYADNHTTEQFLGIDV